MLFLLLIPRLPRSFIACPVAPYLSLQRRQRALAVCLEPIVHFVERSKASLLRAVPEDGARTRRDDHHLQRKQPRQPHRTRGRKLPILPAHASRLRALHFAISLPFPVNFPLLQLVPLPRRQRQQLPPRRLPPAFHRQPQIHDVSLLGPSRRARNSRLFDTLEQPTTVAQDLDGRARTRFVPFILLILLLLHRFDPLRQPPGDDHRLPKHARQALLLRLVRTT